MTSPKGQPFWYINLLDLKTLFILKTTGPFKMVYIISNNYSEMSMKRPLHRNYEGFFYDPIGREIGTTVTITWSFAQMCCAMSLICPSIATHRTCQFWARIEPVNIPETIETSAKWGVRGVNRFLYSEQGRGILSSGIVLLHDNARPHTTAATKRHMKCFWWEVFDHPPSYARTWLPVIFTSCLFWNCRSRTEFWHNEL